MRTASLIVLVLSVGFGQNGRTTRKQDKAPVIKSFISSSNSIFFCRVLYSACAPNDGRLTLTTTAEDLRRAALTYSYEVTAGKIEGEGARVIWNLSDVANGEYTATVSVKNKRGATARATLIVTIADCGSCDAPPPPCPVVTVTCPSDAGNDKPIIFTANVKTGESFQNISYEWVTTAGRIVEGKFANKMTLDLSGLPFGPVTATVSIIGADPSCTGTTASCTIRITQ